MTHKSMGGHLCAYPRGSVLTEGREMSGLLSTGFLCSFLLYFLFLSYTYEYFGFMNVCAPLVCLVPVEVKR